MPFQINTKDVSEASIPSIISWIDIVYTLKESIDKINLEMG